MAEFTEEEVRGIIANALGWFISELDDACINKDWAMVWDVEKKLGVLQNIALGGVVT
jgi:hypothetical protein